jgi:hypothetical protein
MDEEDDRALEPHAQRPPAANRRCHPRVALTRLPPPAAERILRDSSTLPDTSACRAWLTCV